MPPHIDRYRVRSGSQDLLFIGRTDGDEALRFAALQKANGLPLPQFNTYVVITAVHEDDECRQQFDPENRVVYELPIPESTQDIPPINAT